MTLYNRRWASSAPYSGGDDHACRNGKLRHYPAATSRRSKTESHLSLHPFGMIAVLQHDITDRYLMAGVNRTISCRRIVGPMPIGLVPDEAVIAAVMPRAPTVSAALDATLARRDRSAGTAFSLADTMVAPRLNMLAVTPGWG